MQSSRSIMLLAFLLAVTLTRVIADTTRAKDCEIINLRNRNGPIYTTIDESLKSSFFTQGKHWNLPAVITDATGETTCNLVMSRSEKLRRGGIECPGRDKQLNVVTNTTVDYIELITGIWTDILIDIDTCGPNPRYEGCKSRMKIIFKQLLSVETYRSNWIETPLQLPLKIEWRDSAQADLVLNCDRKECLVNSSVLVASRRDRWVSFSLKPGNGFQGFSFSLELQKGAKMTSFDVDMGNVTHGDSWINVTLDREDTLLKVLVDGKELETFSTENFIPKFRIKSVELNGEGLLTWCDPTLKYRVFPESTLELIYWIVIGGLGVTLIALSIALKVVCNKPRHSQPQALELATYPATTQRPVIVNSAPRPSFPPRIQQEGAYETVGGDLISDTAVEEHIYDTIDEIIVKDTNNSGH